MMTSPVRSTPHKKTHIINQHLSTVESSQIWKKQIYDSFMFKDTLTKNEIQVKQMKRTRNSCKVFRNQPKMNTQASKVDDNNKQYLDNCMKMLSSTQIFQKESLKNKIFKCNPENRGKTQQQKISEVIKQKKKLRQIFTSEINKINMKEFRKYIQNQDYLIDHKVMSLIKNVPTTLTKASIQRIIDIHKGKSVQEQQKWKQKILLQRSKINNLYNSEEIKLDGQDIFVDKMVNHMHSKLKDSGQYLIKPTRVTVLQKKTRSMTQKKASEYRFDLLNIQKLQQSQQLDRVISSLQFKKSAEIQSVKKVRENVENRRKIVKNQAIQQQKLHFLIKHGQCSQVRHMLLQKQSLYDTVDEKRNNLLHIAAKYNAVDIFGMVAKSSKGYRLLSQKNQMQRKPCDIVKIMGSQQMKKKAEQAFQFHFP